MTRKDQQNLFHDDGKNGNVHSSSYRGQQPIRDGYYGGQHRSDWNSSGNDEIELTKLLGTILRHKWWVVAITVLATALAYLYVNTITPIYQSSGTMLIVNEQGWNRSGGGTDLSSFMQQSYGVGQMNRISNEIQTLQSRQLSDIISEKVMFPKI